VDHRTLKFLDNELEQAYQADTLETRRRRQRRAALGAAVLFLLTAFLGPMLAGLSLWPCLAAGSAGSLAMFGAAALDSRAKNKRQLDIIAFIFTVTGGFLILALWTVTDTFVRFGAASLMMGAIFTFGVARYPFASAIAMSLGYATLYIAFAFMHGFTLMFDSFMFATALAGATSGTYLAERGERRFFAQGLVVGDLNRRANELLHSYLAPNVADSLIADPARAELGGEEAEVTVLFADLTGFTSFSERVAPEEAVAMLNNAFSAAVPVVLAEGGTIVQFAGDAMMVIFNAPVRQADHALRAARAALRLQSATAAVQRDAAEPRFRVGLNTGPALVGNVGSAELRNFTAIGDTTNLAARLQNFAPPGSVVIGERTRDLLGDAADVRPLGEPELKGKSLHVKVYQLLAIHRLA
jgi:class 3 adenylate cyclase